MPIQKGLDLIEFDTISDVPIHWGEWGKRGARRLAPSFLGVVAYAVDALKKHVDLVGILSAGAYVPRAVKKGDRHATGTAFDLSGLAWRGLPSPPLAVHGKDDIAYWRCDSMSLYSLTADWCFYLALEAVLRLHVPQVLNWWAPDRRHKDHWHLDDRPVWGFQTTSHSDVAFLQASLRYAVLPQCNLVIDGQFGPRTAEVMANGFEVVGLAPTPTNPVAWGYFLTNVAEIGFSASLG